MVDQYIHLYEKISLGSAGIVMGLALLFLHGFFLMRPKQGKKILETISSHTRAGQILLSLDFLWIFLLILDVDWNPLAMNLFDFNPTRGYLLILCPILWAVLYSQSKQLLFPRALGLFLLLLALVPLTAAFLKEPVSRLLIPIWWYPVLTLAIFWVGKPYLFRDWACWLAAHRRVYLFFHAAGALYGAAVLACALAFWM